MRPGGLEQIGEDAIDLGYLQANVLDAPEEREARTVPAGESKTVGFLWEFGGPASNVLGADITWVWQVRIGNAEHSLRVPMQRQTR